jgi:DNA (cytosine-5)-methyltransferase 1
MTFIELFAGIGGFRYGLERCSIKDKGQANKRTGNKERQFNELNNRSSNRLFNCVYANEWDKYACQIYRKHYGEGELHEGDITTVDANDIPDHNLLCGGFPCQAFSIAGKRKGFEDTRGTLFFDIARILDTKRPRMLLLENVKGLLSHDNGNTFRTILWVIDELGYDSQWQVLNSKDFGVPQNRERVFIVGHLRGQCRPEVFPIRESNQIFDKQDNAGQGWTQTEYSTALRGSNMKADNTFVKEMNLIYEGAVMSEKNKQWLEDGKELSRNFPQGQRVYNKNGISSTIAGNAGGLGGKTGLYAMRGREDGQQLEYRGNETNSLTSVQKDNLWVEDMKIRRLTPTECERLQGFPDNWTAGVSDTQRYKCLGNAVTTTVITEIGRRLIKSVRVIE